MCGLTLSTGQVTLNGRWIGNIGKRLMRPLRLAWFGALVSLFLLTELAHAESVGRRVALVIGNGEYATEQDRLINPPNDARAVATKLEKLGFDVTLAVDRDMRGMRDGLRAFDRSMQGAETALFFYAGHGMEYRGRNYLFPVDAELESESDIDFQLVNMDTIQSLMESRVPTQLIFLDACRNNPLAGRFRNSLGRSRSSGVGQGLARMDASDGTFIAYATAPGETATDGEGGNSPFSAALVEYLDEPNLDVRLMMDKVRLAVRSATGGKQTPWESSSLLGPFIFNPDAQPSRTMSVSNEGADVGEADLVFWRSIADSNDPAMFRAYLEEFGDDGRFERLARLRLATLEGASAPTPVRPADRTSQDTTVAALPNANAGVGAAAPAIVSLDMANAEKALRLDRRQWAEVQRSLLALGHDPRGVDGMPGNMTRNALRAWQEQAGVQITGYLTEADRKALVLEAEQSGKLAALPPISLSAGLAPGARFKDCPNCPQMVVLPAGTFTMGSPPEEAARNADEGPLQSIEIGQPFAVGVFEVTFAEWQACRTAGGCGDYTPSDNGWGGGKRPLINVSWQDAVSYVEWLSTKTGKTYRLLSEAEWEYAARAGGSTAYSTGEAIAANQARFNSNVSRNARPLPTAPVGSFPANAFGLHDMHGNVYEWIADCYQRSLAAVPADGTAVDGVCSERGMRGGFLADRGTVLALGQSLSRLCRRARRRFRLPGGTNVELTVHR